MSRGLIPVSVLAMALLGPLSVGLPSAVAQEATPGTTSGVTETANVVLRDVDGQDVGIATLSESPDGEVSIGISVEGLTAGEHGIHVHETGVCEPAGEKAFTSAGGHYNPTGVMHGGPERDGVGTPHAMAGAATPGATTGHAGDLGNILVDEAGMGELQIQTDRFRMDELADADGSALVIHADRDDLQTDPSGNSGGRIVCGVIAPPQDGATPMATPAS
jgi:Cu-Zn family superoxide dismutase